MKNFFQLFLGLFGMTAIFIASLHLASMDSEDRFYATLFAAYGVALLGCIKDIERKSMLVYFLALTFLAGGLARLVSVAAVGLPNTFFVAMTVLELLIPFWVVFMQSRISKELP